MIVENPTKPLVTLAERPLSSNPSRNYAFHLLHEMITQVNPRRSLDAGIGELRNFWMFPGQYVGIGHERFHYFQGIRAQSTAAVIKHRGRPEVYLMRLESDFSFLGAFDLVVCTATIFYVQDQADVVARLSDRVQKGGALILDAMVADFEQIRPVLDRHFTQSVVVYWGHEDYFGKKSGLSHAEITSLTRREMALPNVPGGHRRFTVLATGKRAEPTRPGPRPEMIDDDGLNVVKNDVPFLKM